MNDRFRCSKYGFFSPIAYAEILRRQNKPIDTLTLYMLNEFAESVDSNSYESVAGCNLRLLRYRFKGTLRSPSARPQSLVHNLIELINARPGPFVSCLMLPCFEL